MSDQQTLDVYDAKIGDYIKLVQAPPSKTLLAFINAVPPGGRVLDLGCGPGAAAAEMARHGLQVDATDASPEMVAHASKSPGVNAMLATYDDIPSIATYHGIFANFSLLHATRDKFKEHIAACKSALYPGGVLHLGLKTGAGEKRDRLGRFYTYYSVPELEDILAQNDFT
ncbi:MAG: class I SAM-dependent methyltransferase, partial [Planktomarina sp.]